MTVTLDTLQAQALKQGDMELFDAITSEQLLGNGTRPENHRVRSHTWQCYVCGWWDLASLDTARMAKNGWCDECESYADYLTQAIGTPEQPGLIQQQAERLPQDSPEREELRNEYKHSHKLLANMRERRAEAHRRKEARR